MWGYAGNRVTCNVEIISCPTTLGNDFLCRQKLVACFPMLVFTHDEK